MLGPYLEDVIYFKRPNHTPAPILGSQNSSHNDMQERTQEKNQNNKLINVSNVWIVMY